MEELKITLADVLEKGVFTASLNEAHQKIFTVHIIGRGDPKHFPRVIIRESELPKYWKRKDMLDLAFNKYKLKI